MKKTIVLVIGCCVALMCHATEPTKVKDFYVSDFLNVLIADYSNEIEIATSYTDSVSVAVRENVAHRLEWLNCHKESISNKFPNKLYTIYDYEGELICIAPNGECLGSVASVNDAPMLSRLDIPYEELKDIMY